MRRLESMVLLPALVFLGACTTTQPYPREYAACYEMVQRHAAQLLPVFETLGYRPEIHLQLDDEMRSGRGFRKPDNVLGDAIPSGRIRLRPSRLCGNDAVARAVLAHEMAHVALQHRGAPGSGLVLEWERPAQHETEADELALAVLRKAGGNPLSARYIECRLGACGGAPGGSASSPAFRWRSQ